MKFSVIIYVSLSIIVMGFTFVSYVGHHDKHDSHHRSVASLKKKQCDDLLNIITRTQSGDVAVTEAGYEALFKKLIIQDHALKDYTLRHNLIRKEFAALAAISDDILQASRDLFDPQDIRNKKHQLLEDALTYIHSCRGYQAKRQDMCLSLTKDVVFEQANTVYTKRFKATKKKVAKYRRKVSTEETVSTDINKRVLAFKSVRLACSSQVKNARKNAARNYFLLSVAAGEVIANSATYFFGEHEGEKDRQWQEAMIYDVLFNSAFGFIQTSLVTLKQGAFASDLVKKSVADYMIRAARDIPAMLTYSQYLAPSQEELHESAKELMSHPAFKEQLETLLTSLHDEKLLGLVQNQISRYNVYQQQVMPQDEQEQMIDELSEVLAHQAYQSQASGFIQTGDLGHDYYAYNRLWDMGASVESIGLSMIMLRMMCLGDKANMATKALTATVVYAMNKALVTTIYQAAFSKNNP